MGNEELKSGSEELKSKGRWGRMTIEELIAVFEEFANNPYEFSEVKNNYKQYAEWLKILKKAKFEYDEAWRILTHPTPDVRYPDIDRAKMILDVFRDSLGRMD